MTHGGIFFIFRFLLIYLTMAIHGVFIHDASDREGSIVKIIVVSFSFNLILHKRKPKIPSVIHLCP